MTTMAYRRRVVPGYESGGDTWRSGTSTAARQAGEVPETQSGVSSALATITAYIPTEILVTYVAVVAAMAAAGSAPPPATQGLWLAFWLFLVATPVVVWLEYAGKLRTAARALPRRPRDWPRWEMVAATAGYVAWAFALPGTPFTQFSWYNPGVAGVAVLITATGLGMLTPVVIGQPPLAPPPGSVLLPPVGTTVTPSIAAPTPASTTRSISALGGFLPSRCGLPFANSFPHEPLLAIPVPGLATLSLGDAANGLCGGMAFTVRDLFEADVPPPTDATPPGPGTPRFEYLVARQIASLDFGRVPLRLYELGSPLMPAAIPDPEPLTALGVAPHGRSQSMILDAWPAIRGELDAGHPSVVGLVRVINADPASLGDDHQVLAYGYGLDGDRLSLAIYDPNHPDDDSVRLTLSIADPTVAVDVAYSAADGPVYSFIHIPYAASDPTPWR
jgi:hypothetical protein